MYKDNYNTTYDVFHSYLVWSATYAGEEEFPCIKSCNEIPNKLVPFSEAIKKDYKDFDCWVCFYELDYLFIRFWNNPKKYLPRLKKFRGVISPDFSLYANMPLVMQKYHIYMSRALANWLIENGVKVIPNVRLGDERSYKFAFNGLYKGDIISIGTIGTTQDKTERKLIVNAINKTIEVLEPNDVVIYGSLPKETEDANPGVHFHVYESYTFKKLKEKINHG
ncbi:MAG: DUF4417 domain-containing protein [Bacilli bacterium]|nr:DUF4417 domain-containing protein [Bacilli bacterium]